MMKLRIGTDKLLERQAVEAANKMEAERAKGEVVILHSLSQADLLDEYI